MPAWEENERRSPDSVLAMAATTAKEEADSLQRALEQLPSWRYLRRARLTRALEDSRRREREAREMLRANRRQDRRRSDQLEPAGENSD